MNIQRHLFAVWRYIPQEMWRHIVHHAALQKDIGPIYGWELVEKLLKIRKTS